MSLLFLPSASFAGSFLSLSLFDSRSKQSKFVGGDHNLSSPSLSLSLVTQLLRHHGANIPQSLSLGYLGPFTLTLHGKRRRRRQVATLQNTHATLRNTDVAPISPLSLSHVRRDHRHRRRRVGLTRPTLNPRLNTKRPLARPDFGAGQRGCFSRCRWWELGTGKGRAARAHPISRPAPLAVSQHKM